MVYFCSLDELMGMERLSVVRSQLRRLISLVPAVSFPDIVINNAGILRDRSFARISNDDWGKKFTRTDSDGRANFTTTSRLVVVASAMETCKITKIFLPVFPQPSYD